jgi:hypothetical protein
MFERFTEKARRVIFFARYEASNYGSHQIEPEHLLLGLLREDRTLRVLFPGEREVEIHIREEVDKRIPHGERFSTGVEVPLSTDCRVVLNTAEKTSERLGQSGIDTGHILIGILRVEGSIAAQVLMERGVTPGAVQEQFGKGSSEDNPKSAVTEASSTFHDFLAGLKSHNSEKLISFFATNAFFIDVCGKRWDRREISKGFETLFAPYAKKNATHIVEVTQVDTAEMFAATVLWKNALLASEQRAWMHRMSVVLSPEAGTWKILLAQVTPVRPS